jgi:hypothetical protein
MQPSPRDPRKLILGAVALVLISVVGLFGYVASHAAGPAEKTYTVAPHYVARNLVDLSRMPDSSFLQITENDHVRVVGGDGNAATVEVLEGEFRGEKGWVPMAWLQPSH